MQKTNWQLLDELVVTIEKTTDWQGRTFKNAYAMLPESLPGVKAFIAGYKGADSDRKVLELTVDYLSRMWPQAEDRRCNVEYLILSDYIMVRGVVNKNVLFGIRMKKDATEEQLQLAARLMGLIDGYTPTFAEVTA